MHFLLQNPEHELEVVTGQSLSGLPNQHTAEFAVIKLTHNTEESYQRKYELGQVDTIAAY